ncbi:MAG TPA: FTR1 family protein [Candidatus Bathyarchaeia archaeon]
MVLASLLVTFREALEASLIVTIVSAYLRKIGRTELNRYLLAGSLAAVLASLALGWTIHLIYGELEGPAAQVFEGTAALTATIVLTYMVFWMGRNARTIRHEIEQRVDIAVSRGQTYGIFALAFVAVVREGIETVLFLTGVFFLDPSGTIIGITLGIGTVLILVMLLLKGTYKLDIRRFFKYSSILLVVLAAGLAGFGVHELIEASESSGVQLGLLSQEAFNINPADNTDIFHEKGVVGSILRALVGYDGNPEWLRVVVYLSYWTIVGAYLLRAYRPVQTLQR